MSLSSMSTFDYKTHLLNLEIGFQKQNEVAPLQLCHLSCSCVLFCFFAYADTLWVMWKCFIGFGWINQTSRAHFKIRVIIIRVQSKLTTTFQKQLKLRLSLSCSPSTCWCLIEMTLEQTAEHVWSGRKNTAGCHRTADPMFGWFRFGGRTNIEVRFMKKSKKSCALLFSGTFIKRRQPQHPSLSLCSWEPPLSSLTRHLEWLLSAWSLSLSVWVCLNKLLWWPVATQNQFPATGWFASPCPNSCLGPFNGMVKHTYCKVEQTWSSDFKS